MARHIGIDIRPNIVRVAALRSSYRKVALEGLNEVDREAFASLEEAIAAAVEPFARQHENVAVGLDGGSTYVHRVPLPPAALKQVEEVLPFELEAQIPVDMDELVFDSRVLPRERGDSQVEVLAAAAPIERVQGLVDLLRRALGREPERVGAGAVPLGNLASTSAELGHAECAALLDVGEDTSDLAILASGTCLFARTLSVGVAGLPGNAEQFLSKLRQSLTAWLAASDHPVTALYLLGAGPAAPGMAEYLSAHLSMTVDVLPKLRLDTSAVQRPKSALDVPEADEEHRVLLAAYGKAIALALSLRPGARDLNLRSGAVSFQHGFGFLKEKVPVLAGLMAVLLVSFLFSAWARNRALSEQRVLLSESLSLLSKEVLNEETDDADYALELLDNGTRREEDPQPEMDGFGLLMALEERIPDDIEHNIEELDYQKTKVTLRGVVPHAEDAQKIGEALKEHKCIKDVKTEQITRFGKSDQQKYTMTFEVRCQEPKKKPPKPSLAAEGEE